MRGKQNRFLDCAPVLSCPPPRLASGDAGAGESKKGGTIRNINRVARCLTDLSLTQVLGLLSCADGFVGNDSGITHLAAGLGVKTLAVFGPTNPAVYGPIGPAVTVFADSTAAFVKGPSAALQQELLEVLMA